MDLDCTVLPSGLYYNLCLDHDGVGGAKPYGNTAFHFYITPIFKAVDVDIDQGKEAMMRLDCPGCQNGTTMAYLLSPEIHSSSQDFM